jgi:hypothetical protein
MTPWQWLWSLSDWQRGMVIAVTAFGIGVAIQIYRFARS